MGELPPVIPIEEPDNHHNALVCAYCRIGLDKKLDELVTARCAAQGSDLAAKVAALPERWGIGDEDDGVAHVVGCQDFGCKTCVVIACASDLRALLADPADTGDGSGT